ncbi:MAG: choline dehydrogenase [Bacteroidetes bacterium]|nr:choline dehydrogenase [Bacteroidota bacterium]
MKNFADHVDYILVGAGSAGCVLANRLSADPSVRVLLLEAGVPDAKMEIPVPGAFYKLFKTEVDWAYSSTPQPGLNGRSLFMPRGKTLGGSSSINAMIYIRGHRSDYDHWQELGNPGWDYESVLPLFRRSEDFADGADEFHGEGGDLTVSRPRFPHEMGEAFIQSAEALGFDRNNDFNGEHQTGFGRYHVNIRNGKRCSSAVAFLRPILNRPNLTVVTQAQVSEILMEEGRATGVRCMLTQGTDGRQRRVQDYHCRREVILCGGAINSPQLLMLSGIGPKDHLEELGLPVLRDLPGVGLNLQDHLFAPLVFSNRQRNSMDTVDRPAHLLPNLLQFFLLDRGPLTSNIAESGGFIRTVEGLRAPDMQFHFIPAYFVNHGFERPDGHGLSLCATLLAPQSRGSIQLRSADPLASPIIDPQHYSKKADLETMKRGVQMALEILRQEPMAPYLGKPFSPDEHWPNDAALEQWIRNTSEALYHPVGTCKMGQDSLAVVDASLRVHGIRGLRVADASIMPEIVRGNTHAPTVMIGEKAADLILEDARQARKGLSTVKKTVNG